MTENAEAEISMKRYLLGELTEPEQQELEEGLMTSNESFEQLFIAEDKLVDEYLCGSLSAREEERFHDYFLCTPERHEALRFSRSLHRYVLTNREQPQTLWGWPAFLTFRTFPHRIIEGSLAAALSLMVLGGSWLTFRVQHLDHLLEQVRSQTVPAGEREDWQRQLAQLRTNNDQLATEVRFHKGQRAVAEQELAELRASTPLLSSPSTISFPLTSGSVRSEGKMKKLTIPTGTNWVQLQLELGASDHKKYRAALRNADGEEIWSQVTRGVKTTKNPEAIVLTLPAELLPHGDYRLKLNGIPASGDIEPIESYSFSVLQK